MGGIPVTGRGVFLSLTFTALMLGFGCTPPEDAAPPPSVKVRPKRAIQDARLIRFDYASGELMSLCNAALSKVEGKVLGIKAVPVANRNFDNVMLALENALADFGDETNGLTFMAYVSKDEKIHDDGAACEKSVEQFSVKLVADRALYNALKGLSPRNDGEKRLLAQTLKSFEQNGMMLNDQLLASYTQLNQLHAEKTSKFSDNLNKDKSTVEFSRDELDGVPEAFLNSLNVAPSGRYVLTTKSTDYTMVMENASKSATRKMMMLAYLNRAAKENTVLLEETVQIRAQMAQLLGKQTYADLKIEDRMAGKKDTVLAFLEGLKSKLHQRNSEDLKKLLAYKKTLDPSAQQIDAWDINYLSYQLKKKEFQLDTEKVREYFPADVVIAGMFKIYSQLLGVEFAEVNHPVWAEGVKLYAVHDKSDGRLIAFFYTDFIPRQLKYGHAAAFSLVVGRELADGGYNVPISSIVANFTKPIGGKPSLLTHGEVETLFHEFGHIMHQTLTQAPYASLAGSSVARDFVEAPSQMLENWVWSAEMLQILSGHYETKEKLPDSMLKQMLAAQDFGQGIFYTRQLLYGLFDMSIHTAIGPINVTQTYDNLFRAVVGVEPLAGAHFPASFGHMMGGYAAGYYGYLWSEVYAQDMFSIFPANNILSPEIGGRYRKAILEQGSMKPEIEILKEFLGREPSTDAFYKKLGIN